VTEAVTTAGAELRLVVEPRMPDHERVGSEGGAGKTASAA